MTQWKLLDAKCLGRYTAACSVKKQLHFDKIFGKRNKGSREICEHGLASVRRKLVK